MLCHLFQMLRFIPPPQQPPMYFRMKGLYPPIQHLRKICNSGNLSHIYFIIFKQFGSSTGRNNPEAKPYKPPGKLHNSSLIRNRE